MLRSLPVVLLVCLWPLAMRADNPGWALGGRVVVDKAGVGRRAIILKVEPSRCFVAYEGEDGRFDEWVEDGLIRAIKPPKEYQADESAPTVVPRSPQNGGQPQPENPDLVEDRVEFSATTVLPRPGVNAAVAAVWLEPHPRTNVGEPLRFNEAKLVIPQFALPAGGGVTSQKSPMHAVILPASAVLAGGFAAMEGNQVVVYRSNEQHFFSVVDKLDLSVFGAHRLVGLSGGDLNGDGLVDLVVVGGPVLQVFFATSHGSYEASGQPYRSRLPLRAAAVGRFFSGSNPSGVAVVEGENDFRLLSTTAGGLVTVNEPNTVKFDRILDLVAGDFDGDGFSDIAVTTEQKGLSTGAWMYFNRNNVSQGFIWPVGGRDDFARKLAVDDLDRDGRDDLIMTDNDADRGERVRVVFGSAGRSGWEDPWELIGQELGVGLGTGSVVTGDFNADGRRDIGVAGRNGLRVYLGADYRRFGRNPVWPVVVGGTGLPDQRAFLSADFDGDGRVDLLGFTPIFATGYNMVVNATPADIADTYLPPPLKPKAPKQTGSTVNKIERVRETPPGTPDLRFLASRAEPYGPYRFRIVVEVAATDDGVVQLVDGVCKYANEGPLQEVVTTGRRLSDDQWSLEVVLPRGRNYEFTIIARDDKNVDSLPLRVVVSP